MTPGTQWRRVGGPSTAAPPPLACAGGAARDNGVVGFSEQQCSAFGAALNEARLLDVEVDPEFRRAVVTLATLALAEGGEAPPDDPRVQFVLEPVGRIAASLRHGHWDDPQALEEPFELEELSDVVAAFDGQPIYGWEFLDVADDEDFARWEDRLSLDWEEGDGGRAHTLDLSQAAGITRHLDLRLWFDDLRILGADGGEMSLRAFTTAGVRSWEELHGGDPRTLGQGIEPGPRDG